MYHFMMRNYSIITICQVKYSFNYHSYSLFINKNN